MAWTEKFKKKPDGEEEKNKRLVENTIRIRINRLINKTPVELGVFEAQLGRDENNNVMIYDEAQKFKEEMVGSRDALVTDILYKLESRGKSPVDQLEILDREIEQQEKIISQQREGKLKVKTKSDNPDELEPVVKEIKINIITEKSKLRLLKCVKYVIKNLKGEGSFEKIENDGMRCLEYLVRDGEVIPYWYKTPTDEGEPVIAVPDVVQRKKFFKEKTDELKNDLLNSQDNRWKNILGTIFQVILLLILIGNIVWSFNNVKWTQALALDADNDVVSDYNKQLTTCMRNQERAIANCQEVNGVMVKYAVTDIEDRIAEESSKTIAGEPIKI